MKITRKNLRHLIFEMLDEVEVKRAGTTSGLEATTKLLGILGAELPAQLLNVLLTAPEAGITAAMAGGAKGTAAELMKKALMQKASKSVWPLIRGAGKMVGPVFLLAAVWEGFTYLPSMLQKSIEQLETVEGILKQLRSLRRTAGNDTPLKLTDIADKPGNTLIVKTWSREEIVDYLAAVMEVQEGMQLYNELISKEYTDLDGKKIKGPLVGEDFSNAILKRRESIKAEAAEKIKSRLIANIKAGALSEEESRQLHQYLQSV
jgi:hypothetical protein